MNVTFILSKCSCEWFFQINYFLCLHIDCTLLSHLCVCVLGCLVVCVRERACGSAQCWLLCGWPRPRQSERPAGSASPCREAQRSLFTQLKAGAFPTVWLLLFLFIKIIKIITVLWGGEEQSSCCYDIWEWFSLFKNYYNLCFNISELFLLYTLVSHVTS